MRQTLICIAAIFFCSNVAMAQFAGAVGYTQLQSELGASTPDGTGLTVNMVEAPVGGNYLPDLTSGEFSGKTITDGTGAASGTSSHSQNVARRFFGNSTSIAPGIDDITVYEANDYLGVVLGTNTGTDPLVTGVDISNHSYIGNGLTAAQKFAILTRFDFMINRDNTLAFVGANNGSGNSTPDVLAPSYNAVTVGRTDGNHSQTLTSEYGAPRTKPDIVAPESSASNATPRVASASAILLEAAQGTNGAQNEAIKAMLFAGATKEEFAGWDKTSTRPIDETFGFGELNIYNSYKIFEGGEFDGETADPASDIGDLGYDFETFDGTNDLFYDFELTNDGEISAVLTWNAVITDANATSVFDPSFSVSNLDLQLYDSSGSFLGTLLDESISTDYNHEHIYLDLGAGQYTLRVSGDTATDYGFAWRISQVPEPSSTVVIIGVMALAGIRRQRSRLVG